MMLVAHHPKQFPQNPVRPQWKGSQPPYSWQIPSIPFLTNPLIQFFSLAQAQEDAQRTARAPERDRNAHHHPDPDSTRAHCEANPPGRKRRRNVAQSWPHRKNACGAAVREPDAPPSGSPRDLAVNSARPAVPPHHPRTVSFGATATRSNHAAPPAAPRWPFHASLV